MIVFNKPLDLALSIYNKKYFNNISMSTLSIPKLKYLQKIYFIDQIHFLKLNNIETITNSLFQQIYPSV